MWTSGRPGERRRGCADAVRGGRGGTNRGSFWPIGFLPGAARVGVFEGVKRGLGGGGRNGAQLRALPEEFRLHGVDLTPSMLEIACNRAVEEGLEADLRERDAQESPFSGESFDCMVSTLSLCSLPDHRLALAVRCPGSCAPGDGCC